LDTWLREQLPLSFENRIPAVDVFVANAWGQVEARGQAAGRSIDIMDGFLAATAHVHRLTLVTRNEADFSVLGHSVLNPWTA
jgi:predicted nucleic acid-binding protein